MSYPHMQCLICHMSSLHTHMTYILHRYKHLMEFLHDFPKEGNVALRSWLYILYSSRDRPLLTAVFSCLQISLPTNKMKDAKMKQLKKLEKGFNFIENRCLMTFLSIKGWFCRYFLIKYWSVQCPGIFPWSFVLVA